MIYVAEAAANDILRVNPNNGEISVVAVLPGGVVGRPRDPGERMACQ